MLQEKTYLLSQNTQAMIHKLLEEMNMESIEHTIHKQELSYLEQTFNFNY